MSCKTIKHFFKQFSKFVCAAIKQFNDKYLFTYHAFKSSIIISQFFCFNTYVILVLTITQWYFHTCLLISIKEKKNFSFTFFFLFQLAKEFSRFVCLSIRWLIFVYVSCIKIANFYFTFVNFGWKQCSKIPLTNEKHTVNFYFLMHILKYRLFMQK